MKATVGKRKQPVDLVDSYLYNFTLRVGYINSLPDCASFFFFFFFLT